MKSKQVLFLITFFGFLIIHTCFVYTSYASDVIRSCISNYAANRCNPHGCNSIGGYYNTSADAASACGSGCSPASIGNVCGISVKVYNKTLSDGYRWYIYDAGFVDQIDNDNDGIPNEFDLLPDSPESYKGAITSVLIDATGKIVAGIITTDDGLQFSFGTVPDDLEGCTFETLEEGIKFSDGQALASQLAKLDCELNLHQNSKIIEVDDQGKWVPDTIADIPKFFDDRVKAPVPEIKDIPVFKPDANDNDRGLQEKIVKNTAATNENLRYLADYLGISNDLLAKILSKSGKGTGGGTAVISTPGKEGPTADEIGTAVKDKLIDPSQTIDTTLTDAIEDVDESPALTLIQTKYSDRYDLFITNIKESDLFSLPFEIFDGPSGSGTAVQTVNIGKWGSTSIQTATIDYSDYDNLWDILRSVYLLVCSFGCIKILVLKR